MTAVNRLISALDETGELSSEWRDAFTKVDRGLFVPDTGWAGNRDQSDQFVDRAADPDTWTELVYANTWVVTQWDDGATPITREGELSTSSSSQPMVMARMLTALDVRDDSRVLEIGTGTGYNTALLCHRLGDENVTSVEVDPTLAEQARENLARAGYHPRLIIGDGASADVVGDGYDRVLATCSFTNLPYTWVAGTRLGGRIVAPMDHAFAGGFLACLDVNTAGIASGHFGGWAVFMSLRSQRYHYPRAREFSDEGHPEPNGTTRLHPAYVLDNSDAAVAIGLRVPDCYDDIHIWADDDPDAPKEFVTWFLDPTTKSWATVVCYENDDLEGEFPVRQEGPRRLWDEIVAAMDWWLEAGTPERDRLGMTVTPDRQWVWLDSPDQPVRPES